MDRIGYATKAELLKKAKELNIVGRWDMTKGELMEAVTKAMEENAIKNVESSESEYRDINAPQRTTQDYVNDVNPGTVVAFKVTLGGKKRVLSAKVNAKCSSGHLLVETKNGSKYRVGPDDVVWVKTGARWPRWVLDLLKGEGANAN